jgi:ABC-2 type transport system ATP-binding protein
MTFGPGISVLTGSNGAGKSTLLRTIATLHPLDGGAISLGTWQADRDRRKYLSHLMFMPQNFATYPSLTGEEVLMYALRLRGASVKQARAVAGEWLRALGLEANAKTATGAYSQGMRQRLGFAYTLQTAASLYLLDEPFSGVDAEWRPIMLDLLFQICADPIAIVVSHDPEELVKRGGRTVRLSNGGIFGL